MAAPPEAAVGCGSHTEPAIRLPARNNAASLQAFTMRLLPLLLAAPAAVLALASSAQALTTYNLSYTTQIGSQSLQGTLTIDETDPAAQQTSVSGIPSFLKSLSLVVSDGSSATNFSLADYDTFVWDPVSPNSVNFAADLVPQFQEINFINFSTFPALNGCDTFLLCTTDSSFELTSAVPQAPAAVPAPLSLFGAAAAFHTSRRLRRRLKSRA